jgi:hypothetical protein
MSKGKLKDSKVVIRKCIGGQCYFMPNVIFAFPVSFVISYKSVDNHVDILSLAESNEDCEIHPEITLLTMVDALRTENVLICLFLKIYLWY